jgi:hypothetical protein
MLDQIYQVVSRTGDQDFLLLTRNPFQSWKARYDGIFAKAKVKREAGYEIPSSVSIRVASSHGIVFKPWKNLLQV